MTLLGCGHLGDSEFKEYTVIYCREAPYKKGWFSFELKMQILEIPEGLCSL